MKRKNIAIDGTFKAIKNAPWLVLLLVAVTVGVVLSALAPPYMLRIIIDDYIVPGNLNYIVWAALFYLLLIFINNLFEFLRRLTLVLFGQRLYQHLQEILSDKFIRLKTLYYTSNDDGQTASYFVNDVDTINHAFTAGLIGMFIDGLKVIGILVALYMFSPVLTLVVCIFLPVIVIITRLIQKAMLAAQMESRQVTGGVNNAIAETKEVFNMIKLGGREGFMMNRWSELLSQNYKAAERVNMADSLSSPMAQILRAVVIGVVVYLSPRGIGISIGMLAASIELITNLFDPIEAISNELQQIQRSLSGIKRLNELYNENEENRDCAELPEGFFNKAHSIKFANVNFEYVENTPVLNGISFSANPHEKLAIAGRTGVGKTTMFNLITGLYEPSSGAIQISGVDAAKIPPDSRRQLFAYVSQSFMPIIGTLKEQVTLKDEKITHERFVQAMETVGLHETCKEMYDNIYHRGLLSSGQEQLLNIARAIVMEPKILLLDEMSSKLDSISEERIHKATHAAGQDMTSISISHRLSSMLNAQRLIYVKNGEIDKVLDLEGNTEDRDWVIREAAREGFGKSATE
ncbi:MAG: ABC transporter ATP-binding protein/permease [Defluviitaleaceae bacterium]|nr:ABC transporter ATP-binding protein/permease [Defluviitaleaceae bacterium]